jgi:hypothetical protein
MVNQWGHCCRNNVKTNLSNKNVTKTVSNGKSVGALL